MRLFQVCMILCAFRRYKTSEVMELVNSKALAFMADEFASFKHILHAQLFHGTCYTDRLLKCIRKPSSGVRACDGSELKVPPRPIEIIESYSDTVPYSESGWPIPKNNRQTQARWFTAFLLDESDVTTDGAGMSLKDVVSACIDKEAYFEAIIRLMNAVESVGISAITRFCDLAVILHKTQSVMKLFYEDFSKLLEVMQTQFQRIFISTEPIREIQVALQIIQDAEVESSLKKRRKFFQSTCEDFSWRYGNMVGYVMKFVDLNDITTSLFINTSSHLKAELSNNISKALSFFQSIDAKE